MVIRSVFFAISITAIAGHASGQETVQPPQQSGELSTLFARLDEAEQSYRFAQLALAAGDIRSAISSLERVLQFNPGLSNIKYELGLLYLQVGQSALAQAYLEQALSDPAMPADQRALARQALRRADEDRSRFRVNGFMSGGLRWDDNPSAATESILLIDTTTGGIREISRSSGNLVSDDRSDAAVEASGSFQFGAVFAEQMGHELVVDVGFDITRYNKVDQLNSSAAQVRVGPRINFGNASRPAGAFRPYIASTSVDFGDENLFSSWSVGGELEYNPVRRLNLNVNTEFEERDYNSAGAASNAEIRDGSLITVAANATWQAGLKTLFRVGASGSQYDVDRLCEPVIPATNTGMAQDCESFDAWHVDAGVERQFQFLKGRPLRVAGTGSFRSASYAEGDPFIDPGTARQDDRLSLSMTARVPLNRRSGIYVSVGYTDSRSNLPNFDYDNTHARAGLTLNF